MGSFVPFTPAPHLWLSPPQVRVFRLALPERFRGVPPDSLAPAVPQDDRPGRRGRHRRGARDRGGARAMKRLVDIGVAAGGLAVLWPLLLLIAVAIRLGGSGPVIFTQERIGRGFRPFRIYKFRTMVVDAERRGPAVAVHNDRRVTGVG